MFKQRHTIQIDFMVVPTVPTEDVSTDEVFAKQLEALEAKI